MIIEIQKHYEYFIVLDFFELDSIFENMYLFVVWPNVSFLTFKSIWTTSDYVSIRNIPIRKLHNLYVFMLLEKCIKIQQVFRLKSNVQTDQHLMQKHI